MHRKFEKITKVIQDFLEARRIPLASGLSDESAKVVYLYQSVFFAPEAVSDRVTWGLDLSCGLRRKAWDSREGGEFQGSRRVKPGLLQEGQDVR